MTTLNTRFIRLSDIPTLLVLESRQWDTHQAATAYDLQQRIERHPRLCVASFDHVSGAAVSSLFMKPMSPANILAAPTWFDCAGSPEPAVPTARGRSLFGTSLTSIHPSGTQALMDFFWPHALQAGWTDIYLGSPIPGFAAARAREPHLTAEEYAQQKIRGLPRDPQLRYYYLKGFREAVAVKPSYFPHAKSLDHAVILRGKVPLSGLTALWRRLPWPMLQRLSHFAKVAP